MWLDQHIVSKYNKVAIKAQQFFLPFPSTCIVESAFSQGHLDNKAIQLIYDVTSVVLIFALTEIEKRFSHAARVKVKSLEKC